MRTKEGNIHNRHKTSFYKQASEIIRISDIVLEILDARFINESRFKELEQEVINNKKILIHVINKSDLLPKGEITNREGLSNPIFISAKDREGINKLRKKIQILARKIPDRERVHIGVIGYPNTGKSSILNILARHAASKVSSQPGFTKGIQKIRLSKGILLLDSPGIIPANENLFGNDQRKHGLMGVKSPEGVKDPDLIVNEIMNLYPGKLEKFYKISKEGNIEVVLEELGKRWRIMKKHGEIDTDRVARKIIKEWHSGKIKL